MRIHKGGIEAFRMAAFKPPSDRDVRYLRERIEYKAAQYGDAPDRYRNNALQMFDKINSSNALHRARELWRNTRSVYDRNVIHCIESIEAMQAAKPVMQRWIMACPEVRKAYKKQSIQGYPDEYVDIEPDAGPYESTDYKLVTNGLIYRCEDGVDAIGFDIHYGLPLDETPSQSEIHDIVDTWAFARHYISQMKGDLTNPYGGNM